jgi:hypothetical protein
VEFGLAYGAFQAEQQSVIEVSWIIRAVLVEDQGIGQGADLEQSVPVHRVSCEPRYLQPKHDSGTTETDFRHQALKTFAVCRRGSRLTQVRINDHDLIRLPA